MRKNLRLLRMLPVAACALALAACGKSNQQNYMIPEEASKIDVKKIDAGATALRLADAAYAKGDFNMAAQLYFRAAELQPENGTVMVKLGFALFKTGGAQDAEKIFRATLAAEPKNADAMRGLAHSLVMQGKAGQALPLYRQAIAAQPDARIYAGLGAALDMVGKHHEARAAYAAGLKLAPDDFSLKNNLALSYAMSGDTAKARGILSDMSDDPAAPKKRESIAALQTTVAKAAVPPRKQPAPTLVAKAPAEKPMAEKTVAERPGPVAGLAGEVREIAEATPRSHRPRGIQKAIADLPGADTIDGEIYIRTGRATVVQATAPAGAAPKMLAMSLKTTADTPEEEAAEVLELLAQAERGPRFVWQMARRPDAS
jgi:Flp pilus assembly protein TadD